MIDVGDISVVQLPPADPGALRSCAGAFQSAASQLSTQLGTVTGTAGGLHWSGPAQRSWNGMAHQQASYLRAAVGAFGDAADALSRLAGRIEDAQTAAARANADARDAVVRRQSAAQAAALNGQPPPPDDGSFGRAQAAGQKALEDFHQAANAAVASFHAVAAAAPSVLAVPGPAQPLGFSGASPSFLTLLLGSVADNRIAGTTWQDMVLRELGLDENFQLVPPELLFGRSRPDGLTESDLYELKNVIYQARSRQLRVQLRYAEEHGLRFNLVVNRNTRISRPLARAIEQVGGRIMRYQGNGIFTNNVRPNTPGSMFRFSDGEFHEVEMQPRALEPPTSVRGGGAGEPTGGRGGSGGRGVPEEPAPPEVPETPEVPEVPEVPEIIPP